MKLTTILAASTGVLLLAAPAAAQTAVQSAAPASSSKGFFLGGHLNGSSVTADDLSDDARSGGGAGLQLGWGFTPRLALFTELTVASLDDEEGGTVGFGHFDIGVRYAFTGPTRRFVPSIEAAITGRALAQDDSDLGDGQTGDVSLTGAGFTIGGGVQYYVRPTLALGAAIKWTGGKFTTAEVDDVEIEDLDIDATSARFNIGITWYPMAGRR
jgi:opacity protein-like surface antigen